MATETVAFTGFANGEYGSLSPYSVGFHATRSRSMYAGWWTGQNVMRGLNGALFPRAGEKAYVLTGVPNGVIDGMGYGSAGGFPYIWFAVGTAVYRFRADIFTAQAVTAYTGALAAFTEPLAWIDHSGVTYAFAYPNGLYKIDHGAATVAAVAGSPDAYACCVYGDRLMAASASTLYYSAAADFETWPVDGNIQIGDVFNIRSINTVGGRLAIGKDGIGGQPWFVLSGVPGVNDVLRQSEVSLTAPHADAAVDTGKGVGLVCDIEGTIAMFDGSRLQSLPYLQVTNRSASGIPSKLSAFRLRRPGEWGVVVDRTLDAHDFDASNGSIWLFRNGAWTRHQRLIPAGTVTGAYNVSVPGESKVVFGQGGDASTPSTFCALNPYLDRPPFTSDDATVLDPADCLLSLPEWWSPNGDEVRVVATHVDFLSWNTGSSDPNTFFVDVVAMRTYDPTPDFSGTGGADQTSLSPRSYSQATSAQSTGGTRRRITFRYPAKWGNGFRLGIGDMRGVSIQKIVAVLETKAAQS